MIGKGAKYLTAAGFGRYRITAASLGSLDLLGTVSGWLSKQARQAIMAAFGVDGTAVIAATNEYLNGIAASDKDKATALAGFINEDPMMVCSLGLEPTLTTLPKMPIRLLVGDGNAWITTKVVPNSKMRVKSLLFFTNAASSWQFPLTCNMVNNTGAEAFGIGKNSGWIYFQYRGDNRTSTQWVNGKAYNLDIQTTNTDQYLYDGDTLVSHLTKSGYCNTTCEIGLFYCHSKDGGVTWKTMANIGFFYAEKDDVLVSHMIPILTDTKNGMVDIVTGEYFPNEGTSDFTESFGYMLNGSWVTWSPPTP